VELKLGSVHPPTLTFGVMGQKEPNPRRGIALIERDRDR